MLGPLHIGLGIEKRVCQREISPLLEDQDPRTLLYFHLRSYPDRKKNSTGEGHCKMTICFQV